jgi:hypothetical protein
MRAPNILLVSVLIATPSLLAAGQEQTSTAPTVVQGINAEDGDPKPCKRGDNTAQDAPHDPADKPAPQTTAKRPQPPIGRLAAGVPAVPGPNPPKVIFPPGKPEPITLSDMYWEDLFIMIGFYNRFAEDADKASNHAEAVGWRTSYQHMIKLNDAEGEILQEIAHDCNCAVKELDGKMNAMNAKFHAQIVPGATVTVPVDFYQMFEERKKTIRDHVEQLRVALGDTSFKKLETYVLSMYPAPKSVATLKTPSTTTTATQPKENR